MEAPHAQSATEVAAALGVDVMRGLEEAQARARLARFGPNLLAERAPRAAWACFLDQFKSLLIGVLLAASALAASLGQLVDAAAILVVVLLNATLGFVQERRAHAALSALKKMLTPHARVRRAGLPRLIAARELVPGDVLLLESGDHVSADARIIDAFSAEVSEAALTGESVPVVKTSAPVSAHTVLAGRTNMLYMNTIVTRGRIEAVVTATGMQSEIGQLAGMLADTPEPVTPLQAQLDALGKRLALITLVVVGLMFVVGALRGFDLAHLTLTSLALAVAAIPEGLPAVVTVTLALGMRRMAAHQAIVKKLAAVETLGCTTLILTDKTGTLTRNEMSARGIFYRGQLLRVTGEGYGSEGAILPAQGEVLPDLTALLTGAALCNDARIEHGALIGDPTEGALLALVARGGGAGDLPRRIAEIPFDAANRFMATFHDEGDHVRVWVKGAPDVLLARTHDVLEVELEPLDEARRAALTARAHAMADDAMRVLALATRRIPRAAFAGAGLGCIDGLTLVALVGITDPPRAEIRDAIAQAHAAGVEVKMITGDHLATARAIGQAVGLAGPALAGAELEGLDEAQLQSRVLHAAVLARVSPAQKLAVVRAMKAAGHVVAVTGDGVNDAPALKAADIGVAMGRGGTAVAREAATLVLADDNFATIVRAIREGRTIYDNIVKFVRFQLATNLGAIFTVMGATLLGLPAPFTAVQLLWVNIIMDGPPAMTLAAERGRPGIMHSPPRDARIAVLTLRRVLSVARAGLMMALATLFANALGTATGGEALGRTLAFTTFVLCQVFNVFNARSEQGSAFNRHFFSNLALWIALPAVVVLQVVAVHWPPAQSVFGTVSLTGLQWASSLALAASVLLVEEVRKAFVRGVR